MQKAQTSFCVPTTTAKCKKFKQVWLQHVGLRCPDQLPTRTVFGATNCNLFLTILTYNNLSKGLFTPSVSGSGSGSKDYIDLYLSHSHQAAVAAAASAASLASKHQMGSRPIFPAMPLTLYWVSLDFSCNVDVFYLLQTSSAVK